VTRTVIAPLGLRSTGFDDVRFPNPHRARRYAFYDPFTLAADTTRVYRIPDWDYSHNTGGGNMYATADDLARFGRALMRPGLLSPASLALLYAKPRVDTVESPMSFGWFAREAGAGGPATRGRRLHITGANPGLQAGVQVYPDDDLVTVVLSNTHGVGARSGEMVSELPERVAAICLGRPVPPAPPARGAPRP
jgi:CubicO group peptidase (beta-lactamase class C family)